MPAAFTHGTLLFNLPTLSSSCARAFGIHLIEPFVVYYLVRRFVEHIGSFVHGFDCIGENLSKLIILNCF